MRIFLTGFSLLLLCIGTAFADQSGEERFISERATANQALNNLHAEFSGVRNYTLNGRTTKLYGRAFSFGSSPENSAEQFRLQHAAVLGALPEDLQPVSLTKDKKYIQPMMYNPVTGQYKFSLVNYCQYRDDIPVFRADLRLLVRNEPDYPLVLATSALRFLGDFQPTDKNNINFEAAQNAALSTVSGPTAGCPAPTTWGR